MTIYEAIKTNTDFAVDHRSVDTYTLEASVKLGIEALKRLQSLRLSRITWFRGPLPGETSVQSKGGKIK